MKKSSFITVLFFVLFVGGIGMLCIADYFPNGASIIAGAIFISTAFLIYTIKEIFLSDKE